MTVHVSLTYWHAYPASFFMLTTAILNCSSQKVVWSLFLPPMGRLHRLARIKLVFKEVIRTRCPFMTLNIRYFEPGWDHFVFHIKRSDTIVYNHTNFLPLVVSQYSLPNLTHLSFLNQAIYGPTQ